MGLFDFFKKKSEPEPAPWNLDDIVREMFAKTGISHQGSDGYYLTAIKGQYNNVQIVVICDGNTLMAHGPLVLLIPKHARAAVDLEVKRINAEDCMAKLGLHDDKQGGLCVTAAISVDFEKAPTTDEVLAHIARVAGALDGDNYLTLSCAIVGYCYYEHLYHDIINSATKDENGTPVYNTLALDQYDIFTKLCAAMSRARLQGRLTGLCRHVLKADAAKNEGSETNFDLLELDEITLRAYTVANLENRNIIRTLCVIIDSLEDAHTEDYDGEFDKGLADADTYIAEGHKNKLLYDNSD